MSSRSVLTAMILGVLVMAGLFYAALKKAPEYKSLVTDQMQTEFRDYAQKVKHTERLKVAEAGTESFFVDMQSPWKFEIHDKILVVTAPFPQNEAGNKPLPADLIPTAQKSVQDFVWAWLDDKFHSRKDLQVEVHFPNEPQPYQ